MWQKLLRPHHYNPEPVKPLHTIAESQVWGPAISAGLSFVDKRR
jgi:hypothetical protein